MELDEIEKIVKKKSNYKCVICHKNTEECYAIDNEKGISEDNMISLCYFCANEYLGNPETIKQIKQMRDYWYEQTERAIKELGNADILPIEEETISKTSRNLSAIYHVVYENEGLEESAKTIYNLLYSAKEQALNNKRILYLDIDGHTDEYGRFDSEMIELQQDFIVGTLLPYFYEIHTPMFDIKNANPQREDIPREMTFLPNEEQLLKYIKKEIQEGGFLLEKLKKEYYTETKKIIYRKKSK